MKRYKNQLVATVLAIILAIIISEIFGFNGWQFLFSTIVLAIFIISSYADIISQEVDYRLFILMILFAFLFGLLSGQSWLNIFLAMAGSAILPFFFVVLSREKWMGWGDVLFLAGAGAFLGVKLFYWGVLASFLLGGLFGIILLVSRIGNLKSRVPLGPFVLIAMIVVKLISINFSYVFPF